MTDFGFVIFEDIKIKREKTEGKIKSLALKLMETFIGFLFKAGFFKTPVGTRLYFSKKKEEFERGVSCFELLETLRVWVVKLPFSPGILSRLNEKYVYQYIQDLCAEKGIQSCIVPAAIRDDAIKNGFHFSPVSSGKLLLKCLLMTVIEEIYPKAGKRIEQLDMVIVSGGDNEELYTLVKLLEPSISFVTVISSDKDEIENTFSELFSDSGLSFTITTEYRNHLKNADLIINLGKPLELAKYRMSKKALLVNLYDSLECAIQGDNAVINDISIEISGPEAKNLMYELHGYYSKSEVFDFIVLNKLELGKYHRFDDASAGNIKRDFTKAGMKISGFIGRRGIISADSIIKAVV